MSNGSIIEKNSTGKTNATGKVIEKAGSTPKSPAYRRGLLLVVLTIALVVLILIKDQYSALLLKNSTYGMPALIDRGSVDNLFIGSSAFRQSLDIGVLEKELPGGSYILTYNGNQPVFEYIQLKKLIDSGLKISDLYVEMYAFSLCREPQLDDEKLLMELNIAEKRAIFYALVDKSPAIFWKMYVSSNNEQILTWPVNSRVVSSRFRNGGTLIYSGGLTPQAYAAIRPIDNRTQIDPTQAQAVRDIINLCAKEGISLTFAETPIADNIIESETYKDIISEYEAMLAEKGVRVIRSENTDMQPEDFADDIHLSSAGRAKYSLRLTGKLTE